MKAFLSPGSLKARASLKRLTVALLLLLWLPSSAWAERVGEVSTKFKLVGPNDKIVIEVFQDPDVPGVACYLSRADTGGVSGAVGLAEDTSDSSLACRQVGPVQLPEDIANGKRDGDEVFKKRTSLLTKTMQVVRFYDAPRNTLVYLSYSDRIIEGSPKNSTSVVVIRPWPGGADKSGANSDNASQSGK
ncbi:MULTISPECIES: CreA family protein [Thiorhodovibrio]|uniref:CreA family protein n=1 Tax=Thiorhodovibrio TaxID=61593 RepID=UPI0019143CE8|nr:MULTISPECIES: CreA family protein [Thiorhodovibrio]MBK5968102.1 protein CreA [Thiorhodovibrio winogradskyi]WPL12692.1 CreA protein [Thiorhodovibrio litoralis]